MSKHKVSIVIPCYNDKKYVGEAISSALTQTYRSVEVIVVDDGSTDGSLDVIRSFGQRITWKSGNNRGACHARNLGVENSSGKYVKFLDSDDFLFKDAIRTQVNQITNVGRRTVVFGDRCVLYEGERISQVAEDEDRWTSNRSRYVDEDPVEYIVHVTPQTSSPLHRRELLEDVGGFDERLSCYQEYDLHLRLCLSGVTFKYVPAEVGIARWHSDGQITTSPDSDPKARLRRVRHWVNMIKKRKAGGITEFLRQHYAEHAWYGGRRALRDGKPGIADDYFSYAKKLHENCVAGNSVLYKWAVHIFGPKVAEEMGSYVRRTKEQIGVDN